MSTTASRFQNFRTETPYWARLLAQPPAEHILRHDTAHPAFHGCIDWHSACHAAWALIAYQGLTGDARYAPVVDQVLMPRKLAEEGQDLAARPDFEMPYGRAWFLRLALEDRQVTGSTRCGPVGRALADSLVAHYRAHAPDPFAREYANPSWALTNLFDYAVVENRRDLLSEVAGLVHDHFIPAFDRLPSQEEENSWPDFMAVTPALCDLVVRSGAMSANEVLERGGARLFALKPVTEPQRAHNHALNFSRAWSLFALYEASGEDRLLSLYCDHMEANLFRPSWWRGDYRAVSHWVPQFGMFALARAMKQDHTK